MSNTVRVRFAPSPTGPLHIGGVRTALFNYLYAKKHNGVFVLRIEDTDQKRYVEGAETYIIDALNWCGIPYDEGPGKEGECGPYRQSERKHLYKQYADQLIAEGKAYYAFDTENELNEQRELYAEKGQTFIYNWHNRLQLNNALAVDPETVQAKIDKGEDYVIRFKIPQNETIILNDEIRGEVRVDSNTLDDKVLFKSDGMPTYHLANIVDDHLMEITHVIRGEEWLPSLALHSLLYNAFGWKAPSFAHLPLILKPDAKSYLNKNSIPNFINIYTNDFAKDSNVDKNEIEKIVKSILENPKNLSNALKINKDKDNALKQEIKSFLKKGLFGKLSKRDGDRIGFPVFPMLWEGEKMTARGFKEDGYLPEAVVNFLAFLGWNPGTEQELFSLKELIEEFDLRKVNKAGAKFDPEKAKWFNQKYFVQQSNSSLVDIFKNQNADKSSVSSAKPQFIETVIDSIKERASFASELWDLSFFFFETPTDYEEKAFTKVSNEETKGLMKKVIDLVEATSDFTQEQLQNTIKGWITDEELGFGKVMQPLRLSLVGSMKGPDVFLIMSLLGKEECIKRINNLISK